MTIKPISRYTLHRILEQDAHETEAADRRARLNAPDDGLGSVLLVALGGAIGAVLCEDFDPQAVVAIFVLIAIGYGCASVYRATR